MTTRYTPSHEYVRVEGDTGTVGITAFAQEELGDIVFIELPQVGQVLQKGEEAAVVESVKAASEIYSPVSGTVVEINSALGNAPGLVNSSPAEEGWMFRLSISDPLELEALLDEDAYSALTA